MIKSSVGRLYSESDNMKSIIIKNIRKRHNLLKITLEVSEDIKHLFNDTTFFAEFTFDIDDIPDSVLVVPVLTNLLPFSWITDTAIWVNEIDEDFYCCIQQLKTAFRELHPERDVRGTVIAAQRINNTRIEASRTLQLFTGGIDATATLIRIINKNPILFNTNGWYKHQSSEPNPVFDADYKAISMIAQSHKLRSQFVKSNFGTFISAEKFKKRTGISWWFTCQHSLAFLGCAMVAAYKYGVSQVYIASSYTFGQYVVCISDPRIDNCVSCASIKTIHDGYELSRQDKVALIANYSNKNNIDLNLRVCSFNTHNCCSCEKCFRSMLALVAEGVADLSKFGFYFEDTLLNKLKTFIDTMAMELDHNHIVFWKDIINLMKTNYDKVKYKDVVDYLLEVDLEKARKCSIMNHYRKDFFSILKRKLHIQ